MKALTLTQPWATLVAIGAKKIETRSWLISYRGPLAIHAAKGFPKYAREIFFNPVFQGVLIPAGYRKLADLPLGEVVATCELTDVAKIVPGVDLPLGNEWNFGDYSYGRFMWTLEDVFALIRPVPAKGALRLWEWDEASVEWTWQLKSDGEKHRTVVPLIGK
jgi:hypothetical protein